MQIPHSTMDAVGQSEVVCIHDEAAHWHQSFNCRRWEDNIRVLSVMRLASADSAIVTPLGFAPGVAYLPFSCS